MSDRERLFDGLVRRSLIPRGFRPTSDEEIEAMIDGLKGGEIPEEKLQRMLGKIRGDVPMSWEEPEDSLAEQPAESKEASELAAMYRGEGDELSPELEEKLREFEKRAAEKPAEDDEPDGE
jgi:hypothetical protein